MEITPVVHLQINNNINTFLKIRKLIEQNHSYLPYIKKETYKSLFV